MTEELGTVEGISRRDMLKRSAIVGGGAAMVWAAPSVTTFGARAFGSDGTPATAFSNFGAIIRDTSDSDKLYKIKGNQTGALPNFVWEAGDGMALGGCEDRVPNWGTSPALNGGTIGALFTVFNDGNSYRMTLPAEGPYQFVKLSSTAEGLTSAAASSLKQGQCCIAAVKISTKEVEWQGPFPNGSPQQPCSSHPQNLPPPT